MTWQKQVAIDYLESRGWVWAGPDGRRSKWRHETLTRSDGGGVIYEVNLKKALDLQRSTEENAEPLYTL